jgi:hypothetical protein
LISFEPPPLIIFARLPIDATPRRLLSAPPIFLGCHDSFIFDAITDYIDICRFSPLFR